MARIFITGSSAGLGLMAAQLLISQSHEVVLHRRNQERADAALAAAPGAVAAVTGDLARLSEMRSVAGQVNRFGRFDAVIHNAGVGYREARRIETEDGFPHVFAINVLAPYILTALIERPERLVYLSSGMHYGAGPLVRRRTHRAAPNFVVACGFACAKAAGYEADDFLAAAAGA